LAKALKNLVVFICDALRYDYARLLGLGHKVIRGLAPSIHTPPSVASLLTGESPLVHGVGSFFQRLGFGKTPIRYFKTWEFFDHPYDPLRRIMLGIRRKPRDIKVMKEPFLWIERTMFTHVPYGYSWLEASHEVTKTFEERAIDGRKYIRRLKSGELNPYEEYMRGVVKTRKHIKARLALLEEMGVLDRTLVAICSDHGEILDPRYPTTHSFPPHPDLVQVPIIFLPEQELPPVMRLRDLLPTALDIMGISWRREQSVLGKDIKKVIDACVSPDPLDLTSLWECNTSGARPLCALRGSALMRSIKLLIIKTLTHTSLASFLLRAYLRGQEPLSWALKPLS